MGEDEGEEINAKVGKDVAHPPVGVHGAVDDLCWNARQHESCGEHRGLGLLFYLEETLAMILLSRATDNKNVQLCKFACYIHVSSDKHNILQPPLMLFITSFRV